MNRKIFITATDTGAGKTFVTSHLIRLLLERGEFASAIKPVASGISNSGLNEDVDLLMQAQKVTDPNLINLYSFQLAASPNIAAAAEGKTIDPKLLTTWCHQQADQVDLCLIEGVGGLMVPLSENYLVSDWMADIDNCDVMLVVGARLGSINHALLTLAKLKQMNITPAYIIINTIDDATATEHVTTSLRPLLPEESQIMTIPNWKTSDAATDVSLNNAFSALLTAILAKT